MMPLLELGDPVIIEEAVLTMTEPVLQEFPRELRIGGTTQDNSITVVENPRVEGYIGYLFAGHFVETKTTRCLTDTTYFRINLGSFNLIRENYSRVYLEKGFSPAEYARCDFLLVRSINKILPRPTIRPYEIGFLEPDLYNKHLEDLKHSLNVERVLYEINSDLAARIRSFGLDHGSGLLILPENYATLDFSVG